MRIERDMINVTSEERGEIWSLRMTLTKTCDMEMVTPVYEHTSFKVMIYNYS